jgi:hypothetical protein
MYGQLEETLEQQQLKNPKSDIRSLLGKNGDEVIMRQRWKNGDEIIMRQR